MPDPKLGAVMMAAERDQYKRERDEAREALGAVTALLEQQTGFSGGSLPIDEPCDPIDHEINEAVRQAKDALAAPSSRNEAP